MNQHLADTFDLMSQTKFAHWNVKGPNFIALHKLFDELAETLEGHVDEIAERATALGWNDRVGEGQCVLNGCVAAAAIDHDDFSPGVPPWLQALQRFDYPGLFIQHGHDDAEPGPGTPHAPDNAPPQLLPAPAVQP